MIGFLVGGQMMVAAELMSGRCKKESGVTTADPCIDLSSTSHQSDWPASIQQETQSRNKMLKPSKLATALRCCFISQAEIEVVLIRASAKGGRKMGETSKQRDRIRIGLERSETSFPS